MTQIHRTTKTTTTTTALKFSVISITNLVTVFILILTHQIENRHQCSAQNVNQKATLHGKIDAPGQSAHFDGVYIANLQSRFFDDKAYYACVTGIWIFYENTNYNSQPGLMEYIFHPNNKRFPNCTVFQNLGGRVSSARYAGHKGDYRKNAITLYEGTNFQGEEEYTFNDRPNLTPFRPVSSLIISGKSAWTLYDSTNYEGNSLCVFPPISQLDSHTPKFVYDTNVFVGLRDAIQSVRLGCYGTKKRKRIRDDSN